MYFKLDNDLKFNYLIFITLKQIKFIVEKKIKAHINLFS